LRSALEASARNRLSASYAANAAVLSSSKSLLRLTPLDYDVAVFIKDPCTLTEELDKLATLTTAILLETGAVISAKPFLAEAYRARTAFMHDLRRDGLDL
jgi:hypothetical protein